MSVESMNKLADDYILPNGMVNYLYCFRNYIGDITSMGSSSGATPSIKLSRLQERQPTGL